jgi:uncharacterized protein YecE (DUF72 family)
VERTPRDFRFDIKAFALMTGHAAETARLPSVVRGSLPPDLLAQGRVYARQLSPECEDLVWELFREGVQPLADAGRLGAVFLQFAPWVHPTPESPAMLERARERLGGLPAAVEFRNGRWMTPRLRERTLALLGRLGMSYVAVDEPQGMESSVPPVVAVSHGPLAVLRMHGQRADRWEARGIPVVERYRYLYTRAELASWIPAIESLAEQAEHVHVVFNNCYANYGVCNAAELIDMLAGGARG